MGARAAEFPRQFGVVRQEHAAEARGGVGLRSDLRVRRTFCRKPWCCNVQIARTTVARASLALAQIVSSAGSQRPFAFTLAFIPRVIFPRDLEQLVAPAQRVGAALAAFKFLHLPAHKVANGIAAYAWGPNQPENGSPIFAETRRNASARSSPFPIIR